MSGEAGGRNTRAAYSLLLAAAFAWVALWRWDLVVEAWGVTGRQLGRGGAARWKTIGEVILFGGILLATFRIIPSRARLAHDATAVALAAVAGFAAEAWGTRTGLWRYYTGETPPLWILPAWPLGALMIDRLGTLAEERWGSLAGDRACKTAGRVFAAACLLMFAAFARPALGQPASWAMLVLVAACALAGGRHRSDAWRACAGLACVFFADLWGTTNRCWSYHTAGPGGAGLCQGIAFGMLFDTALALGCLKAARIIGLRSYAA